MSKGQYPLLHGRKPTTIDVSRYLLCPTYCKKQTKVVTIPTSTLDVKNMRTEKKRRCTEIIEYASLIQIP